MKLKRILIFQASCGHFLEQQWICCSSIDATFFICDHHHHIISTYFLDGLSCKFKETFLCAPFISLKVECYLNFLTDDLICCSTFRRGADAWSLMYPSVPDKLQKLYNDGYKLVCFLSSLKLAEILFRVNCTNLSWSLGKYPELSFYFLKQHCPRKFVIKMIDTP